MGGPSAGKKRHEHLGRIKKMACAHIHALPGRMTLAPCRRHNNNKHLFYFQARYELENLHRA